MPVDTREKRQTTVHLLVPIFPPGVDPSSLDESGRRASIWSYANVITAVTVGFVNWIQLEID